MDNVAKIFPSSTYKSETQVFRFSCELNEMVDPIALQKAVNATVERFPFYLCVLKRGLFWYYLDQADIVPLVREEYKQPCAQIYYQGRYNLLFEVTYFKQRINLEVFHVLSDGTGAMHFFRSLIIEYLSLKHKLKRPPDEFDASNTQMSADSFRHHYSGETKTWRTQDPNACRQRGWRFSEDRIGLITGHASVKVVLAEAHRYHVSMTTYLCACMMEAVREVMTLRELKRPIVACIPVNLRNYFSSNSIRNFFNTIYVPYLYEKTDTFEDTLKKVEQGLAGKLTAENMADRMNAYAAIEDNVFAKVMPLVVKDVVLQYFYRQDQKKRTYVISNLGIVRIPEPLQRYIRAFDIYSSTDQMAVCICSFGDVLSINFTSPFISTDIQRAFFRRLSKAGIELEIATNIAEGGEHL